MPIRRPLSPPLAAAVNFPLGRLTQFLRWVYNFDGATNRGVFANRLINPDGDIDIEWRSGPTVSFATSRTIVSQTLTTVGTNQEFFMFVATNGNLAVRVGGLERGTNPAIVYQPNTKYRWRLQGTVVNFWINDVLQPAMSLTRGTAREPTATTQIGSTTNAFFYLGGLFDVRINGVLYPLNEANQTIQLPWPRRLGAELITQTVLENPAVKGSQWTYLGGGRWQYIGDGTQNGLIFLGSATTPTDMFVEFEVESFSGAGNMRLTSVVTGVGDRLFNTTGVKRYYFTNDSVPNIQFERNVGGAACSCVIKNISFKPLWVASATELVTNGNFNSGTTGWVVTGGGTIAVSNGQCTLTTAANQNSRFEQNLTLEPNAYYVCECDAIARSGNGITRLQLLRGSAGNFARIGVAEISGAVVSGKLQFVVLAPATDAIIQVNGDASSAGSITVDNISVRKLDSLCTPLTLINTTSPGWQQIDAPPLPLLRWVYNFDGVDDRAVLADRAINPDGNNSYEFWTPTALKASNQSIISQNIFGSSSLREFDLFFSSAGNLLLIRGGTQTTLFSAAQGVKPGTKYGMTQTGDFFQIFEGGLGGPRVRTVTALSGTAREPAAQTAIGCRTGGTGLFDNFFQGPQYDVRINGTLYPMSDYNQTIQLPSPSGLGAELITRSRLENPAIKGSQWTYLGDGRWQLIGDGELNDLRFLSNQDHPSAGFLEFEIESISGSIRTSVMGLARSVFSTVGKHRYFYTDLNEGGTGGAAVIFRRHTVGVPASCVIKNISFKPLGTCNPLTLSNTTSPGWQEIEA